MCIFCERVRGTDYNFNDLLDAENCTALRSRRKRATLVTGFLGAGKTTFLNYVLSENHGKKLGVLINEFGETSVDDTLIVTSNDEPVITMANGCVCCKIRDDLVAGLLQLADMELDGIIVETSGLAEVLPVCQTFFDPRLQDKFTLDAVIAVVDAGASLDGAAAGIQQEQLLLADAVLLNKVDRLQGRARQERVAAIQALAPHATVIPCRNARVNLDQVLDLNSFALSDEWFSRRPAHLHHSFQSQSLSCDDPLDAGALKMFLQQVIEHRNVIRCKGVLVVKDPTGLTSTMIVQGVGGHVEMEPVKMDASGSTLVLIGPNFVISPEVEQEFARCTAKYQAQFRGAKSPAEKMLAAF
eukprot:GEMP01037398.1.p1 GENE.GEMP01037398.1~~GEMP01037398.1.p1  ORF type:complete len:356 (+),score=96.75 GEMP01037398.1:124-1191(+)